MNKDRAINILLEHEKKVNDPNYKPKIQGLTAAILFMDKYITENKKDTKVEINGLEFKLMKGI